MPSLDNFPAEVLQNIFEYVFDSTVTSIKTDKLSLLGSRTSDFQQEEENNDFTSPPCSSILTGLSMVCRKFYGLARMAFWNTGTFRLTMDYSFQYLLLLHHLFRIPGDFSNIRLVVVDTLFRVDDRGFNFGTSKKLHKRFAARKLTLSAHGIALETVNSIIRYLRLLPRLSAATLMFKRRNKTNARRTLASFLAAQSEMPFKLSLQTNSRAFCASLKPCMRATRQANSTSISICLEWPIYRDEVFCMQCHTELPRPAASRTELPSPWMRCARCNFGALCSVECYQSVLQWRPGLDPSNCNIDCPGIQAAAKSWDRPEPSQPLLHHSDGCFKWIATET